ncbi:MAG: hypothetical protein B6243_13565 [Anaerolineaceae bacterium 4572_5.2]|nr:MAG: hypothetical protein B6243_13565 [Anaerolineaceae bacterium 4572_5.2]
MKVLALIMAGGANENLSVLTAVRSEAALPFGGKFRIIDFVLSNCSNSQIYNAGVLTQYIPQSLHEHVGAGKPWELDRSRGGIRILQPYLGPGISGWQKGTADAVRRNLDFIEEQRVDTILNQRVLNFMEKPKRAKENTASMGVYVFKADMLKKHLLAHPNHVDFGRDVLPGMIKNKRVFSYKYEGYWANIGALQAYWEANMALISESPALDMYDPDWVIHTRSEEQPPAKVGPAAQVGGNLLSNGCIVNGVVEHSVIGPGVFIAEGASVSNSIIMNDCRIEAGAIIQNAILDKEVTVEKNVHIGYGDDAYIPNKAAPDKLNTGLTVIGKRAHIPADIKIGHNVVIEPNVSPKRFKGKDIPGGETVKVSRVSG